MHRFSLSVLVMIALVAGIASGLFFGEYCRHVGWIGNLFVDLMQMSVLPYISLALIANIGRLSPQECRRMAFSGGISLLTLWLIAAALIVALTFVFPTFESGAYFSSSVVAQPAENTFLSTLIPSNPFRAFAEGIVPSIVVFSVVVGIAFMAIPNRDPVLQMLDHWIDAMLKVSNFAVRLSPVGVFAITASAAGTMEFSEMVSIQGYILVQFIGAAALALLILPAVICSLTPFGYREVLSHSNDAIMTAFATGKVLVVVPLIIESCQELLKKHEMTSEEDEATVEAIVPFAYPFPHLGRLLSLLFIPFGAWYMGTPMELAEMPQFLASGYTSFFGSPLAGVPYLLDQQRLPADLLQMYLGTGVLCGRLSDVAGAQHFFALTLLTVAISSRRFRIRWNRLIPWSIAILLGGVVCIFGSRTYLARSLGGMESPHTAISEMQSLVHVAEHDVLASADRHNDTIADRQTALDRMRQEKVIRFGYHPDNLPFSFFNTAGELVGLDIDLAHLLANDLSCRLEFIPFEFETLEDQLNRFEFDVAGSGIAITPTRLLRTSFSKPYMNVTFAFLVPDHLRHTFRDAGALRRSHGYRVGVARSEYFAQRLEEYLPNAEIVRLGSPREFFEQAEQDKIHAMLVSAEAGSAWTLVYPSYSVAVPQPDVISQPVAFAVRRNDVELASFLSQWIELQQQRGGFSRLYDHWILGKSAKQHSRRWSIGRDVLGWLP